MTSPFVTLLLWLDFSVGLAALVSAIAWLAPQRNAVKAIWHALVGALLIFSGIYLDILGVGP